MKKKNHRRKSPLTGNNLKLVIASSIVLILSLVLVIITQQVQIPQKSQGRAQENGFSTGMKEKKSALPGETLLVTPAAGKSFSIFGYVRNLRSASREGVDNVQITVEMRGPAGVVPGCQSPVTTHWEQVSGYGYFVSYCENTSSTPVDAVRLTETLVPAPYTPVTEPDFSPRCCDDVHTCCYASGDPAPGCSVDYCAPLNYQQIQYNYNLIASNDRRGPVVFFVAGPPPPTPTITPTLGPTLTPTATVTPRPAACNSSVQAGGQSDRLQTYEINMGGSPGNFRFSFQNYCNPDQVEVFQGDRRLFSTKDYYRHDIPYEYPPRQPIPSGATVTPTPTPLQYGFMSGGNSVILPYNPSAGDKIRVEVYAINSGTAWKFEAECPSATLTITPTPSIPEKATKNIGIYANALTVIDPDNYLAFGETEGTIDFLVKPKAAQPEIDQGYQGYYGKTLFSRRKIPVESPRDIYSLKVIDCYRLVFYKNEDYSDPLITADAHSSDVSPYEATALPGATLSHVALVKRNLPPVTNPTGTPMPRHQVEIWVNGEIKASKIYPGLDFGDRYTGPNGNNATRLVFMYHPYNDAEKFFGVFDEVRVSRGARQIFRDYYTSMDMGVMGLWRLDGDLTNSAWWGRKLPIYTCFSYSNPNITCDSGGWFDNGNTNAFVYTESGDSLYDTGCDFRNLDPDRGPQCRPTIFPPQPF